VSLPGFETAPYRSRNRHLNHSATARLCDLTNRTNEGYCVAWRNKGPCKIWRLPYDCSSPNVAVVSNTVPIYVELCRRFMNLYTFLFTL